MNGFWRQVSLLLPPEVLCHWYNTALWCLLCCKPALPVGCGQWYNDDDDYHCHGNYHHSHKNHHHHHKNYHHHHYQHELHHHDHHYYLLTFLLPTSPSSDKIIIINKNHHENHYHHHPHKFHDHHDRHDYLLTFLLPSSPFFPIASSAPSPSPSERSTWVEEIFINCDDQDDDRCKLWEWWWW